MEYGEPTQLTHQNSEINIGDRIHGRCHNGDGHGMSAYLEADIGLVGIDGDISGHDGHFIKTIGPSERLKLRNTCFIVHN